MIISNKIIERLYFFFLLSPTDFYSIQLKHFLLSLYFTNLLIGYIDNKAVINKTKNQYDHFIYRDIMRILYLNIISKDMRKLSYCVFIHNKISV